MTGESEQDESDSVARSLQNMSVTPSVSPSTPWGQEGDYTRQRLAEHRQHLHSALRGPTAQTWSVPT